MRMIQFYVCMFAAIVHTRLFNNHVLFSKNTTISPFQYNIN